jgi:hypothetical protein
VEVSDRSIRNQKVVEDESRAFSGLLHASNQVIFEFLCDNFDIDSNTTNESALHTAKVIEPSQPQKKSRKGLMIELWTIVHSFEIRHFSSASWYTSQCFRDF